MRISKNICSVFAAIGVCAWALSAQADVFNPNNPVTEVHAVGAGHTAGSFAASGMMGAKGHSNLDLFANWENLITSECAVQSGATPWPGACNPNGMAHALLNRTGRSWVQRTWTASDQASALNEIVASLQLHGSPAIVPIYGQADHWVAVVQVTATANGSGGWNIGQVKVYDGGPTMGVDGNGNSYGGGLLSYSGSTWKMFYYLVLENINPSCDPCTSDPWYNQYVLMWEPPAGSHTNLVASFPRAPGVADGGLGEKQAQALVWKALTAAHIDADPQIWSHLAGGEAGAAHEVNGVAPTGERWDYFLVPILAAGQPGTVKGFVQLSADDGSFEGVHVLPVPMPYSFVTRPLAEKLAAGKLNKGESLTAGIVTWDPRARSPLAKSPSFPYYEFGIVSGTKELGVVRVSVNTGAVIRVP
ncbi:MAG TPA: hypothetical protein VK607_04390 [Kofleriaceae bacterium]|nr:hypothetical protein [Kofleriaceae bacterium]